MSFSLAVNDHFEFRIYCYHVLAKQLSVNAFKFRVFDMTGGETVDAGDLASAMSDVIAEPYKTILDSGANYLGVSIQDFPLRTFTPAYSKTGQGAGLIVGADLPTQTCGLITWKTLLSGGKGRGRTYLAFPSSEDNTSTGGPDAGYVTAANALGALMLPPWVVIVGALSVTVVMQITNKDGSNGYKNVISRNASNKWATQRRRGSYGRLNEIPSELA